MNETPEPALENEELAATLVGRTIVAVEWVDVSHDYWGDCDHCYVTLDDGRVMDFGAWGYDAWGVTLYERTVR